MALGKRISRLMRAFIEEQWQRLESLTQEAEAEAWARQEALQELERDLSQPQTALRPAPETVSSTTSRQESKLGPPAACL
jgi:hypothetical protein